MHTAHHQIFGCHLLFFPSHELYSLFFLVHSINSRTSDGGPHSRLSSPPPHYGSCLAFYQEKTSEFLLSLTRDEFIRLENTK